MSRTVRWGGLLTVSLLVLSGREAIVGAPSNPAWNLETARRLAHRIGTAAEALGDLALLQSDTGRAEEVKATLESLGTLETQLKRLCDDADAAVEALAKRTQDLIDAGDAEAARATAAERAEFTKLRGELRGRLERLAAARATLEADSKPTGRGEPRRRDVPRWFGSRRGAGMQSPTIKRGLDWLRRHQSADGRWDADDFASSSSDCTCDGQGAAIYDPGVTGLALLAFLGAGETPESGRYRLAVKAGLSYLRRIQDAEGCIGPRIGHFTYNHACAALALVEAYALTRNPLYERPAQAAVSFVEKCRNPRLAWRYDVRPGDDDTSVTGWMLSVVAAAKHAGLAVSDESFAGTIRWLDSVTDPEWGKVGYTARGNGPSRPVEVMDDFPTDNSESLTAVGVYCRLLAGESAKSVPVRRGVALCAALPPRWRHSGDVEMYYWYYGSLAMHQVGGATWKSWWTALEPTLEEHQRRKGCEKGSWDPCSPWGGDGGRVYATALNLLSLETPIRHRKGGR